MEELKLLSSMVANLPTLAVWVLVGYLLYKVAVVGSIYVLLHYGLAQLFDWLKTRKTREVEYKDIRPMLDGMCIKAETERLIAQLHRIRGRGISIPTDYIHAASIDWLREAIDLKIEQEHAAKSHGARVPG